MTMTYDSSGEYRIFYDYNDRSDLRAYIKRTLLMSVRLEWTRETAYDMLWFGLPENLRQKIADLRPHTIQNLARWSILAASGLSKQSIEMFAARVDQIEKSRGVTDLEMKYDVTAE